MAVDIVRLISILAILAFYLVTSTKYHETREYKVIYLMLWIMHAVLTILDLMVSPTSIWYITVLTLILNIWIIYKYVMVLWPNIKGINEENDNDNVEKLNKEE